ncbi:outer membrane lipoprotein carrier protein LolA [Luteimonas soli]|uniref:Outer membrane lipoprotein carrier protein LolA n=1 Tax=Luteimonas soli TaxID=1648966 RepID=A0ABV7XJX5_9GAMM
MSMHRPMTLLLCACAALALAACDRGAPAPVGPDARADATGEPAAPADPAVDEATNNGPAADARAELMASLGAFKGIRSYHATMQVEAQGAKMVSELDFVAPDRFRMTMPGGIGSQTIIGDTMYMQAGGQVIRSKMPAGMTDKWRDPGRLEDAHDGIVVQALGPAILDGKPVRKFLLRQPSADTPADITMWVDANGLPLQVQAVITEPGKAGTSLIRYSRYNDPSIRITPPQ